MSIFETHSGLGFEEDPDASETRVAVKRTVMPAPSDDADLAEAQKGASIPWYKRLLYLLRGHAVQDINVLHQAGIRAAVGRAEQEMASAHKTYAEAENQRAEAERKRAEAMRLRAEAEEAEARASLMFELKEHSARQAAAARKAQESTQESPSSTAPSVDQDAIDAAVDDLKRAMATIAAKGGQVYLSEDQILSALRSLTAGVEDEHDEDDAD
jgi:hypothetical protein